MQKIMFNERYGLQSAVFEGRKTQTRREPFYSDGSVCCEFNRQGRLECFTYDDEKEYLIHTSRYAKGEIVAVAQSYMELYLEMGANRNFFHIYPMFRNVEIEKTIGWKNKMFVRADLMPHHIKILDIRCERLQDISNEDCLKEGAFLLEEEGYRYYYIGNCETKFYYAEHTFMYIIGKLNGKKFWDTNPYVIVYEFELVD